MSKLSKRQPTAREEERPTEGLPRVNPKAAGIDVGAHEIAVCVPLDESRQLVRTFGTYTADLHALGDWLIEHGIQTVALESTGVYWIPLFEELERRGLQGCLISPHSLRRRPHKSDVLDCQWLQTMHSYGLLQASFRPEADLIALRTLLRHRAQLIEHRAPHILHMQKALLQMNIQLAQALSDVTGETGLCIIRAIVAGERDAHKLAAFRNYRCKKDADEIAQALTGTWREEHLFVLQQSLALFDFYTAQIQTCDAEIERTFAHLRSTAAPTPSALRDARPPQKPHSHSKNAPEGVRVREHLRRITGVDLVAVHGLSASLAQSLLAEIGTDMSKWPTEKHFGSWLGLAPNNAISGGKVLKSHTAPARNRAGQIFRLAARSVMRSHCAFGAHYRRLKARLGPAQALVATAYKLARTVYYMLKHQVEYQDIGAEAYDQRYREREIRYLECKAAKLGLKVSPA